MPEHDSTLTRGEAAAFGLRALYETYGYSKYRMSKFEEYDLYVRNKDFLVSDHIITFTDTNGKLMALKPDVTLSIIKNSRASGGSVQKLYYDENVYRVSKGTHAFQEIPQVGLECMGTIDDYCIYEVLMLAARSLTRISDDCVLDVSHLGVVSGILGGLSLSPEGRQTVLQCLGEKNAHGISAVCRQEGLDGRAAESLRQLVSACGAPEAVLARLAGLSHSPETQAALQQLRAVVSLLAAAGMGDKVRLDFSVINDMNYYNGIVFRGFVNGVPSGVLSGGQYDKLMNKMGKAAGAIGFAVYLDLLDRLAGSDRRYDVDAVLLYEEGTDLTQLIAAADRLAAGGTRVMVQRAVPEKLRFRQLLRLGKSGVEAVEEHA